MNCVEIKVPAPHAIDATSFPRLLQLDGVEGAPRHRRVRWRGDEGIS